MKDKEKTYIEFAYYDDTADMYVAQCAACGYEMESRSPIVGAWSYCPHCGRQIVEDVE